MKEILDDEQEQAPLFKIKHVLIILAIGMIPFTIGILFKIQSWPFGSEFLLIGTSLLLLGFVLAIIKMMLTKSATSFLNK